MRNKQSLPRRDRFIKKKFQLDFSIKFLAIIVIEAVLAILLFLYLSKGTLTTGYYGSEFKIATTYDFFLPALLLSNLIIVGVTGIIGIVVLIFLSHKIAGPLYRFENVLTSISKGDLTQRFKLREKDQLTELADRIDELTEIMDRNICELKSGIVDISKLIAEIQIVATETPSVNKKLDSLLQETSKKLNDLEKAANYFRTSQGLPR